MIPKNIKGIDFSLLGKYFGEFSKIRIKKSTLPYVILCLSVYMLILLKIFNITIPRFPRR